MPGVVGHATDIVEHPRRSPTGWCIMPARGQGKRHRRNGLRSGPTRVEPEIAWAKFEAMAEGARIATKELWGRSV